MLGQFPLDSPLHLSLPRISGVWSSAGHCEHSQQGIVSILSTVLFWPYCPLPGVPALHPLKQTWLKAVEVGMCSWFPRTLPRPPASGLDVLPCLSHSLRASSTHSCSFSSYLPHQAVSSHGNLQGLCFQSSQLGSENKLCSWGLGARTWSVRGIHLSLPAKSHSCRDFCECQA